IGEGQDGDRRFVRQRWPLYPRCFVGKDPCADPREDRYNQGRGGEPSPLAELPSDNASRRFRVLGVQQDTVRPHGLGDVLNPLLPHWFKAKRELLLYFLRHLV